jgi:membrane-associated protein
VKATRWRVIGGAALLLALIAAMALLVRHDAAGDAPPPETSIGHLLREYGYLVGFALIYVEESGIPLFIAGDAFLVYVGHRLPGELPIFLVAWLGFTLAVTLGATNLYLVARRYGRSLLKHRLAGLFHLNPQTLETAEHWFARWGPWALIFGRHVPGLRVPLTVAAGLLLLPYRVFAVSVAVSSSA